MNKSGQHQGFFIRSLWRLDTGALLSTEVTPPGAIGGPWTKVRITTNTPGFRSKRLEDLPMNGFHYFETDYHYPSGVAQIWDTGTNTHQMDVGLGVFPASADTLYFTDAMRSSADSEAVNNSLKDLKGLKVNLGVAFAERKKTSDLVLSTAGRIGNALRSLKKGNFRGASNALGLSPTPRQPRADPSRALANEWLALQYGWKPLLSDVYNAAEEMARMSQTPRKFRVSSSKTVHFGKSTSPGNWYGVPYTRRDFGHYTRKYVYIFTYSNEVVQDFSRFGITNPASVAWELLPWSFVIDWFLPIGEFIDTWDATMGVKFLKGCTTTFEKWRVSLSCNGTVKIGTSTRQVSAFGKHDYVECVRQPLGGFPLPQLPSFNPRISFNRGASTLALLRQRLKL